MSEVNANKAKFFLHVLKQALTLASSVKAYEHTHAQLKHNPQP